MNLGKRIELRLNEMEKDRSFLYDQIPELTPARLSALITRDSKRCELDVQIAKALLVRLEWLNSGELPKLIGDGVGKIGQKATTGVIPLETTSARQSRINEIIDMLWKTDMEGLAVMLNEAERNSARYPLAKQTPSSSQ